MINRIGLTGGIGSGKSLIARMLETMNYPVYYSDIQSKRLCNENPEIKRQLTELFGIDIYKNGILNRSLLSESIFSNDLFRNQVNAIIHPVVRADFNSWVEIQDASIVFNEAAILFETRAYRQMHATILVSAPKELRIKRVMKRDACDRELVEQRMKSQWTDEQKKSLANYCIINDDVHPLIQQLETILQGIHSLNKPF